MNLESGFKNCVMTNNRLNHLIFACFSFKLRAL